jgi:hypothetical protein
VNSRAVAPGLAVVGLLTVLACGCTTWHLRDQWTKPDTGISQSTWDDWECHRDADDARLTPNLLVGGAVDALRVVVDQELIDHRDATCLRERGYARAR